MICSCLSAPAERQWERLSSDAELVLSCPVHLTGTDYGFSTNCPFANDVGACQSYCNGENLSSAGCNGVNFLPFDGTCCFKSCSDPATTTTESLVGMGLFETWVYRVPEVCDETLSGENDAGYRGCQTKTNSGATCQRWDSQAPNVHGVTPANYPDSDLSSNYCRNPDGGPTIWCYTMDGDRYEYCTPIPECTDTLGWGNGYGYTCAEYVTQGWCADGLGGVPGQEFALGAEHNFPEDNCCACRPGGVPSALHVGTGLCDSPLGIRVYDGNGDNEGTTQERTDRCAAACFSKITPLEFGPWSSRPDAAGFGMVESTGRCYCNHVDYASCSKDHYHYTTYEFPGFCDASAPLPNAVTVGDCSATLPSGEFCTNTGSANFLGCTPTKCYHGILVPGDCKANCDASELLVVNAVTVGDCTAALPSGSSCAHTAISGFTCLPSTCWDGSLTLGSCIEPIALGSGNIHDAVALWFSDQGSAEETYNLISAWNTAVVTSLVQLFCGDQSCNVYYASAASFNQDLSSWDVSSVTAMTSMFYYASAFNGDLSVDLGHFQIDNFASCVLCSHRLQRGRIDLEYFRGDRFGRYVHSSLRLQ